MCNIPANVQIFTFKIRLTVIHSASSARRIVEICQIIIMLNYYIPLPDRAHHALLLLGLWGPRDGIGPLIKVVVLPKMTAHTVKEFLEMRLGCSGPCQKSVFV